MSRVRHTRPPYAPLTLAYDLQPYFTSRARAIEFDHKDVLPSPPNESAIYDWEHSRMPEKCRSQVGVGIIVDSVVAIAPRPWEHILDLGKHVLHKAAFMFVCDYSGSCMRYTDDARSILYSSFFNEIHHLRRDIDELPSFRRPQCQKLVNDDRSTAPRYGADKRRGD